MKKQMIAFILVVMTNSYAQTMDVMPVEVVVQDNKTVQDNRYAGTVQDNRLADQSVHPSSAHVQPQLLFAPTSSSSCGHCVCQQQVAETQYPICTVGCTQCAECVCCSHNKNSDNVNYQNPHSPCDDRWLCLQTLCLLQCLTLCSCTQDEKPQISCSSSCCAPKPDIVSLQHRTCGIGCCSNKFCAIRPIQCYEGCRTCCQWDCCQCQCGLGNCQPCSPTNRDTKYWKSHTIKNAFFLISSLPAPMPASVEMR